jgi:putative tricarboxylic transport membrane protein
MNARARDVALGTVMLAVGVTYYWLMTRVQQSALDDTVGPVGLPRFYALLLVGLSAILIVQTASVRLRQDRSPSGEPRQSWRFIGMLLIGVLYVGIVPWLGYLLSIGLLIGATARYQGGSIDRRVIIVAASGAVLLWVLFVAFLRVPQPPGAWTSIF